MCLSVCVFVFFFLFFFIYIYIFFFWGGGGCHQDLQSNLVKSKCYRLEVYFELSVVQIIGR